MTASNLTKQTSSVTTVTPVAPPPTTSWEEAPAPGPAEVPAESQAVEHLATALELERQKRVLFATFTSSLSVSSAALDHISLAETDTHQLGESRRLTWDEMLRQTELSLRQAEAFRRTLRELENRSKTTP